ncbi:autophagy-related protein 13 homolog [Lutzomyia longipalpis]|uniref:autophagy-related protein 13 homolog n=1 Tax=Lutzomyia longipalpis TaxID=7200 RepID=UPI0024841D38|nr:autophagy-related protein 13 homolog [Lutzomyia longipalpis]
MQDKKELEKFIKGFMLKCPQVIVQSRLGEKIQTSGKLQSSNSDWFNISIEDYQDVTEETKKALNLISGESILSRLPLCVEISLKTVEDDSMVLEVWYLGLATDRCDPTQRASYTVYNRMAILLKSLISITRQTPAYKLSRRQSTDSYQILYRVYVGDPDTHSLGDGHKQLRVGQLCTTVGMLSMEVAYRTKMTISPTQTGRDNTIMLKSDHFLKDISPKHTRYHHSSRKTCEKKVVDLDKPMRIGAFVDPSRTKQYTEDDYILPETPPFSWLLRKTKEDPADGEEKPAAGAMRAAAAPPQSTEDASVCNNNNNATRNLEVAEESKEKDINGSSPSSQDLTRRPSSRWSSSRVVPAEDEKLLKELHFPFATTNTPISDLAKFYRDCFNAPPLQGFSDSPLDDDIEVEDLTKQLEQFETSLGDFDSLVTSLCCQSVDDNLNS